MLASSVVARAGLALLVICLALFTALRPATARADTAAGLAWLASQQDPGSGAIAASGDLSYPAQSTFYALWALAEVSGAVETGAVDIDIEAARGYLRDRAGEDSEALAQLVLIDGGLLSDGRDPLALLHQRQNPDGGLGDHTGYDSRLYDSLWALAAFNHAADGGEAVAQLLHFLLQVQQESAPRTSPSVTLLARLLVELQPWRGRFGTVAEAQGRTADALLSALGTDSPLYEQGMALWALAGTGFAAARQQSLADHLRATQQANGSWAEDVFVTASVLLGLTAFENPQTGSGWIRGRVVAADSGRPLAGVQLTATTLGRTVSSDDRGQFLMTRVTPGQHNLALAYPGFEARVQALAFAGSELDLGTLTLAPAAGSARLEGVLRDADSGMAIANAPVQLHGAMEARIQSDASGRFLFAGLAPGDYEVRVELAGYRTWQQRLDLAPEERRAEAVLLLPAASVSHANAVALTLQLVHGISAVPLAGVEVILGAHGARVSDGEGRISLADVAPGVYPLSLMAPGFVARQLALHVPPGASGFAGSLALYPLPAAAPAHGVTLQLQVLDSATAAPLAGAQASLLQAGVSAVTDPGGWAEFRGLDGAGDQLQVQAEGYQTAFLAWQGSAAGEYRQILYLSPASGDGSRIRGKVTSAADGQPVSAARIDYTGYFNGPPPQFSGTAGDYQFSGLNSDDVSLRVSAAGYRTQVTHFPLETNRGITFEYSPRLLPGEVDVTAVAGRLTHWVSGDALAGVRVAFSSAAASGEVLSDSDGYFLIEGLAVEEVTLSVAPEGFEPQSFPLGLVAGVITDVRSLRLIPEGHQFHYHLAGRILASDSRQPLAGVEIRAQMGEASLALTSAADGSFSLADLEAPSGRLSLYLEGYLDTAFSVALEPDALTDLGDLLLRPGSGYLLLPDLTLANLWTDQVITDPASGLAQGSATAMLSNHGYRFDGSTGVRLRAYYDSNGNGRYDRASDSDLGEAHFAQILGREEQVAVTIPIHGRLPFRGAPISVAVDAGEQLNEQNEDNNSRTGAESCSVVEADLEQRQSLSDWRIRALNNSIGHAGRPTWTLTDQEHQVYTSGNNPTSAFIAPDSRNGAFAWSMEVRTSTDDDGQGFVWGLQNSRDYYRLLWSQGNCRCMVLSAMVGDSNEHEVRNVNVRWADNTRYIGYLDYQPGRSRVVVERAADGVVIEDFVLNDNTYAAGRYGFWNSSQHNNYFELFESRRVASADLAVGKLQVQQRGHELLLSAEVGNGGASAVPAGSSLVFYRGLPDEGGTRLAELPLSGLASGASVQLQTRVEQTLNDGDLIVALVDAERQVNECRENNNRQQVTWQAPAADLILTLAADPLVADSVQRISAAVTNTALAERDLSLHWWLLDPHGRRLALPDQPLPAAAPGVALDVASDWPAALGSPAGSYRVQAQVRASDGLVLAEADAFFQLAVAVDEVAGGDGSAGAYGVDVDSDRQVYQAWQTALIDSRVLNQTRNQVQEPALARLQVFDPAGEPVLAEEYVVDRLFAGNRDGRQHRLPLADAVAGRYSAVLTLLNSDQSVTLAQHQHSFDVEAVAAGSLAGSLLATAREVTAGDALACRAQVRNRSQVSEYQGSLELTVLDADSGEQRHWQRVDAGLLAGGEWQREFALDTAELGGGNFVCSLSVGGGAATRLLDFASFRVLPEPVSLELALAPGDQQRLLALVDPPAECTPLQRVDLELRLKPRWFGYRNKVVTLELLDPEGRSVLQHSLSGAERQVLYHGDLQLGIELQQRGRLLLSLQQRGGYLADGYRLRATNSRLDREVRQQWRIPGGCQRRLVTHKWHKGYRLRGYRQADQGVLRDHREPFGPAAAPLLSEQQRVLGELLQASGWSYTLVNNAEDFRSELRSGSYDGFALLAEGVHLDVWTLKHLREAVYGGAGLLLAGQHDLRHVALMPALGVYPLGRHRQAAGVDAVASAWSESWQAAWTLEDAVHSFALRGAEVIARYSGQGHSDRGYEHWFDSSAEAGLQALLDADDDDDHDDDSWQRQYRRRSAHCPGGDDDPGRESDWSAYAACCRVDWQSVKSPAITRHAYGRGVALAAGFDWLLQASSAGEGTPFYNGLQQALRMIRPAAARQFPGGSHALQLTLVNRSLTTPGEVRLSYANTRLLDAADFTGDGESEPVWRFALEADQSQSRTLQLQLPAEAEQAELSARLYAGEDDSLRLLTSENYRFAAVRAAATLDAVRAQAEALLHSRGGISHLQALRHKLDSVAALVAAGDYRRAYHSLLLCSSLLTFDDNEEARALRTALGDVIRTVAAQVPSTQGSLP